LPTSLLESPPVGRLKPRVEVHPPYVRSYGAEAVDLGRLGGQESDPWQADALELILAVRPDGKWACFEYAEIVARQNGKGAILEVRVLAGFFLLDEKLIMWSAHEYKTAMEAFRRVGWLIKSMGKPVGLNLIDVSGILIKVNNTNGEESFERLDTGQRIKFIARSKGSGRGFSGDLNIIDEAFAYTPQQQAALMPTMSARPNPQIIYTSSPPLDGESGEVLFNLRERAERGGDDSLGWRDWGAAGDLSHLGDVDLDDKTLWVATNPAHDVRITTETIARERRSMSAADFARERLGVWPMRASSAGGVIDIAQWARLADASSKRDGGISIGVDISTMRDWAAITVYGSRADGKGHAQLVDYRTGTNWLVPKLAELKTALDPVAIGMGRGTYESLKEALTAAGMVIPDDLDFPKRGDLAVTNASTMSAACAQIIDAIRQESLRIVPATQLDEAVAGAKARATGETIAWARKDSAADISPLGALTVARWAHLSRIDLIDQATSVPVFAFA